MEGQDLISKIRGRFLCIFLSVSSMWRYLTHRKNVKFLKCNADVRVDVGNILIFLSLFVWSNILLIKIFDNGSKQFNATKISRLFLKLSRFPFFIIVWTLDTTVNGYLRKDETRPCIVVSWINERKILHWIFCAHLSLLQICESRIVLLRWRDSCNCGAQYDNHVTVLLRNWIAGRRPWLLLHLCGYFCFSFFSKQSSDIYFFIQKQSIFAACFRSFLDGKYFKQWVWQWHEILISERLY